VGPEFGKTLSQRGVALRVSTAVDEADWRVFLCECAAALGMSPCGDPGVWRYPVDGKGGLGMTIMQPITESFLAIDTWPDHDGAYLIIASCRRFGISSLYPVFDKFGLKIIDKSPHTVLRLG
jgi:S-adenosylmethionine/arginine decarboxylase-like enzyme